MRHQQGKPMKASFLLLCLGSQTESPLGSSLRTDSSCSLAAMRLDMQNILLAFFGHRGQLGTILSKGVGRGSKLSLSFLQACLGLRTCYSSPEAQEELPDGCPAQMEQQRQDLLHEIAILGSK